MKWPIKDALNVMRYLRLLLVVLLAASMFWVASHGSWEGQLRTNGAQGTFIVDLPMRPVWSPPVIPTYDFFRQTFKEDALPSTMPAGSTFARVFHYDSAIITLIFFVFVSSCICGLLYLIVRQGRRDIVLHYILFIAVGLVAGAVVCFILSLCLGGFWPQIIELSSFLGIGFGILLGKWRWRQSHIV